MPPFQDSEVLVVPEHRASLCVEILYPFGAYEKKIPEILKQQPVIPGTNRKRRNK